MDDGITSGRAGLWTLQILLQSLPRNSGKAVTTLDRRKSGLSSMNHPRHSSGQGRWAHRVVVASSGRYVCRRKKWKAGMARLVPDHKCYCCTLCALINAPSRLFYFETLNPCLHALFAPFCSSARAHTHFRLGAVRHNTVQHSSRTNVTALSTFAMRARKPACQMRVP